MADFQRLNGPNLNLPGTREPQEIPDHRARQAARECVDSILPGPGVPGYELALQAAALHVEDAEEA